VIIPGARVLVVGGVRRLGRVIALDLAAHQASVCVSTRRPGADADAQVAALRAAGGASASVVAGDVGTAEGAAELVRSGADQLGGLDALIFAASGAFVPSPPHGIEESSWDSSLDTIAKGFFFTAVTAREIMLAGRPPREPVAGRSDAVPPDGGVVVALTDLLGTQPLYTSDAADE